MTTTDPLHDAFDDLARRADLDPAPDRLAGIARKRRAQRDRRLGAGAGLAVLAVVAGLGMPHLPSGSPDRDATVATTAPSPSRGPDLGLEVQLHVTPTVGDGFRVSLDVTGTAMPVVDRRTGRPVEGGGVRGTRILLDGKEVRGTDAGDVECSTTGAPERYDQTFGPFTVDIPPGDHTVRAVAGWCDATGEVRQAVDEDEAYYLGESTVVDRARQDVDGDGTPEQLVLVDEGTDSVLRVHGSVDGVVSLQAADPVRVSGVEDLDGDGDQEVLVDVRWRSVTALVLVTLDGGRPALVTSPPEGPRRYSGVVDGDFHGTTLIDGVLTTWEGPGDGRRVGPVDGGTWVLEGTRLRLVPFGRPTCAGVDVRPAPC
ncbi:hypothetical protein [Nocardioides marmoribigeumensis]|uniref:VCBS repeat-containing protein n=1 Tax=Nocardioides marmoribigeumensis TaxID=433649 RepID=A0ABU2BWB5_9ACTN|nr:hypothetical protein [Nocardioides marmoribigeumensis]MDR7361639.1 hypothetical protein [Nocardioides marmoribigeumensis]